MITLTAVCALAVVLLPGPLKAQATAFLETFDGTPSAPAAYTNPHTWDIYAQGFNAGEVGASAQVGQHGPDCVAPGFPYTTANTHPLRTLADTMFICNDHVMTALGITGYGAIYMTPPAVADFSVGSATIQWDQSTLRTAARDWTDIVIAPYAERTNLAYNNNDQHIPPHNIHVQLAGTNVYLATQRLNGGTQYGQGTDTPINGDTSTTWDQVFAAQNPALTESPARRDTFQVTLSRTTISVCMPKYTYQGQQFCWIRNAPLPQALDANVWHNQATVMLSHRDYNPEKSCSDVEDAHNIVHNSTGDKNCPPDTWHWDNVNISPAVPFQVIKSVPENLTVNTGSSTRVNFASPSPAGASLEFVSFSHTPDLRVSFDNGATWVAPHIQAAIAPNNGASEENGEDTFTSMPTGLTSIMVKGSNGFWGTFDAESFHILGPVGGGGSNSPTSTPLPTATKTPTAVPTRTPTSTAAPASTATSTPTAPVSTATAMPTTTSTPEPPSDYCAIKVLVKDASGAVVEKIVTRPIEFCTDQ
jgi:cell division septation protein DedD